jgi:hypothetical protein
MDDKLCFILENAALVLSFILFIAFPDPCQLVRTDFPFNVKWYCCLIATRLVVGQNMLPLSLFNQVAMVLCLSSFHPQLALLCFIRLDGKHGSGSRCPCS